MLKSELLEVAHGGELHTMLTEKFAHKRFGGWVPVQNTKGRFPRVQRSFVGA